MLAKIVEQHVVPTFAHQLQVKLRRGGLLCTQRRSVAKSVGYWFVCVCLFVCLFVNTITSERLNTGSLNLGVGAL